MNLELQTQVSFAHLNTVNKAMELDSSTPYLMTKAFIYFLNQTFIAIHVVQGVDAADRNLAIVKWLKNLLAPYFTLSIIFLSKNRCNAI